MKKYLRYALILSFFPTQAQNLVPNPSFEDNISCPTGFMELPFLSEPTVSITGWTRPSEASSDYFNTCATATFMDVPNNFVGHQFPRTGNAYTGGYSFVDPGFPYREYSQSHLSAPLIAGHRYHASFWVSLGEWDNYINPGSTSISGVDQLGAHFSTTSEERTGVTSTLDDLIPQVKSPVGIPLVDTAEWMPISGMFTATGGEEWMILGNFTPSNDLTVQPVVGTGGASAMIYYYYDDVCVLDLDGPPISSIVHDSTVCDAEEFQLSGRDNAVSYIWSDGSTDKIRTFTGPGTYWVKSVDPDNCSLYADTFNMIIKNTGPPVNLGNDTVLCNNASLTLNAYNEYYEKYTWNTGASTSSINVSKSGTYTVTVTSPCFNGKDSITIKVPPKPKALLPQDMILCEGTSVMLRNDQPDVTNTWSTGQQGCCIEVNKAGNYTIHVSNICNEEASDEINITYSGCDNCILAPTAFSPNGDGLNDKYVVLSNCMLKSYALKIYNRWGQLVFQSYSPDDSWDGNVNDTPAELGVYFYHLKAVPILNEVETTEKKGDITLIR